LIGEYQFNLIGACLSGPQRQDVTVATIDTATRLGIEAIAEWQKQDRQS
jgi:hypothetical protein